MAPALFSRPKTPQIRACLPFGLACLLLPHTGPSGPLPLFSHGAHPENFFLSSTVFAAFSSSSAAFTYQYPYSDQTFLRLTVPIVCRRLACRLALSALPPSGLAVLACVVARARQNASMRMVEHHARTAQRECMTAICLQRVWPITTAKARRDTPILTGHLATVFLLQDLALLLKRDSPW